MNVLALDISKRGTGWAAGDGNGPPRSGVEGFGSAGRGLVGVHFSAWLNDKIIIERPDLIAIEKPLVRVNKGNTENIIRLLVGMAFVAETAAAGRQIRFTDVASQSWRKAFTGHGKPHDPKAAALRMCDMLQWRHGGDDNRADAMGVWVWAHLHLGNRRGLDTILSRMTVRAMECRTS